MIEFEEKYFKEFNFSKNQVDKFMEAASKDLEIAKGNDCPEVRFQFSYNSLIKIGIALVACYNRKVSSRVGHHQKILEKMEEILKDKDIFTHGDKMRKTRNKDLYDGGMMISFKQAESYLSFVEDACLLSQNFIKKHFNTML